MIRATLLLFATVFAFAMAVPLPALAANILRMEAVGAVPVSRGEGASVAPKQAAIQAALREAVSRVAQDFLMDAEAGGSRQGPGSRGPSLGKVLGSDMVRYTTSFRILEDRGERPALFVENSQSATEYVVIVEVQVDADRVEKRLVEAGLLKRRGPRAKADQVRLEVLGLHQYAAYQALRGLLLERLGARAVAPVELERGRSVLAVETELAPAELLQRLLAMAPPNMEISPLAAELGSVRLSVHWTPTPEGAAAAPGARSDEGRSGR